MGYAGWTRAALAAAALALGVGCSAPRTPVARAAPPAKAAHGVDIAEARNAGRAQLFRWAEWSPETFARAAAEGRPILLHGAAVWCHWCHVMEETTYRDPQVGAIIRDRFVAIRVDVDARPDIEERYDEWGWPATILLSPDAEELGKLRGYVPPDEMRRILTSLDTSQTLDEDRSHPAERAAPVEALPWIGANTARRLDTFYDAREGGWGMRQKAPLGDNVVWELRRHARGDKGALGRAQLSLRKQAQLIDPVWGGIYQYSAASDWNAPHFEKLMTYQAANLSAYAEGYRISGDAALLAWARDIARYMTTFLSRDDGAFYSAQDADVGAHDRSARFVDGNAYYPLPEAERRALGIPWIDEHVYAEENGLAIAALCNLYQATQDAEVLARVDKSARLIVASHVDGAGRVRHDASDTRSTWHLADAAALGLALVRVHEVGGGAEHLAHAERIAAHIASAMRDEDGAHWAHTVDPDMSGVFARRRKPFTANVQAARLYAALARVVEDPQARREHRRSAQQTLAAIATPQVLRERGRMVASFLLALDEADALDWP